MLKKSKRIEYDTVFICDVCGEEVPEYRALPFDLSPKNLFESKYHFHPECLFQHWLDDKNAPTN